MDVEALRSFLAVARHRSISKAAADSYVTQPAMSREDPPGTPDAALPGTG
ncbi:LysR family transcriptional regulator [Streptomyces sp. NPDC017179]